MGLKADGDSIDLSFYINYLGLFSIASGIPDSLVIYSFANLYLLCCPCMFCGGDQGNCMPNFSSALTHVLCWGEELVEYLRSLRGVQIERE